MVTWRGKKLKTHEGGIEGGDEMYFRSDADGRP